MCVCKCVTRSRSLKAISGVSVQQTRAIHSVPEGRHTNRGADLNGVEEEGWKKTEEDGGGALACVCRQGIRQDKL